MDAHALDYPFPLRFDPERKQQREKRVRSTVADQSKHDARILCAACRQIVTYPINRISIHGSHEHHYANPQGILYRIGCFRQASGCATTDAMSREFSWFPGYAWRVGVCAACHVHLGWRFEATKDYFYGLILNRLVVDRAADAPSSGAG